MMFCLDVLRMIFKLFYLIARKKRVRDNLNNLFFDVFSKPPLTESSKVSELLRCILFSRRNLHFYFFSEFLKIDVPKEKQNVFSPHKTVAKSHKNEP